MGKNVSNSALVASDVEFVPTRNFITANGAAGKAFTVAVVKTPNVGPLPYIKSATEAEFDKRSG